MMVLCGCCWQHCCRMRHARPAARSSAGSLSSCSSSSVAAAVSSQVPEMQLQQCVAWLLPQLARLEPPWLVLLVRGLVRLGCSLQRAQVQELWGALAAMDERVAPKHRKVLTQCLKELGELAH